MSKNTVLTWLMLERGKEKGKKERKNDKMLHNKKAKTSEKEGIKPKIRSMKSRWYSMRQRLRENVEEAALGPEKQPPRLCTDDEVLLDRGGGHSSKSSNEGFHDMYGVSVRDGASRLLWNAP